MKMKKRALPVLILLGVLAAVLLACDILGVRLCRLLCRELTSLHGDETALTVTLYVCSVFAWACLYCLLRLIVNVMGGRVFIPFNLRAMTATAVCCFCVAAVCLAAGIWYCLPMLLAAVAACLMGMIVLIVRGAFALAAEMKDELDYTV